MNNAGELRRAFVTLLAAALVVQGVLGLVPHRHHSDGLPGSTPAPAPFPNPHRPELAAAASDRHPATFCLACAITPSAFSRSHEAPSLTCHSSFPATAPLAWEVACLPRPWRCLQRGPPPVA